jgi:hypothetical protein
VLILKIVIQIQSGMECKNKIRTTTVNCNTHDLITMQNQHLLRTNVSIQKQLSQAPALQHCATNSNVMPHTKIKSRGKTTTTKVVVKHAKPTVQNTTPRPGTSGALPLATQRKSINVAELPSTRRATSNRDRMVRNPIFAS